ncbi:34110_t:CDS:1 [Racocetra persica]|uniref:34110_t:CDS:1 n=1 Tax=Racocetra persica TaxID=160502 RepID=A0ACA9SWD1_9GLOM|nr:34110_t:CDS:1 [Racocetra persica]
MLINDPSDNISNSSAINKILNIKEDAEIIKQKTSKKSRTKRKSKILKKEDDAKNKCIEEESKTKRKSKILKKKDNAKNKHIEEDITEKQKVLKIKFDEMIHKEILNDTEKG